MTVRISCVVLFLAVACALSPRAFAQGGDLQGRMAAERVSLSLKDASAEDVFGIYKKLLGVDLDMACKEEKRVTITFEEITLRTSLNAICESTGLIWEIIDGDPAVLRIDCGDKLPDSAYDEKWAFASAKATAGPSEMALEEGGSGEGDPAKMQVSLNLQEADLAEVLNMVARLLDAKVLVDRSLAGKTVTLHKSGATVEEILDAVCEKAGAVWTLEEGKQRLLTVYVKN